MKPLQFWIVQTLLSYTIGEPVYRVQEEEPDELTKRTSVTWFPVIEKSAYDALKAELAELRLNQPFAGSTDTLTEKYNLRRELAAAKGEIEVHKQSRANLEQWNDTLVDENSRLKVTAVSDRQLIAELRDIFMRIQSGLTTDINKVESMTKSLAGQALEEIRTRAALKDGEKSQ